MDPTRRAFKRILVGTDFSHPAANAVLRAARLAAEHSAKLEIVHVTPRIDPARLRRLGLAGFAGSDPGVLDERVADAQDLARSQGIVAAVRILRGGAPALLAREAARLSVDLVVIGVRGARTLRGAFIGTTAERVVERWTGDTLVVRNAARAPYGTILACVALAPASCSVVTSAAALSGRASVHLVHAYEPPFEKMLISHHATREMLAQHRLAAKGEAVRGLTALLERHAQGGRSLERHVRYGDPATVIPEASARYGADVVVVGRNQSVVEDLFLGSITRKILRSARTDVLVSGSR